MTMQDVSINDRPEKIVLYYEDLFGKFIILTFFLWQFSLSFLNTARLYLNPSYDLMWVLHLTSQICAVGFMALVVGLTVTRKPPVDVAPGLETRVSAFMGTFILLTLIAVPPQDIGQGQMLLATLLILVGTVSSIYCLWWLGKAFSVMAAARNLVTSGPYGHVRHPLYTAEAITVVGVILATGSWLAVAIGAAQFFFQYRRMVNEEKVLETVFPEYATYRKTTPMVLPRLG